jgi:hypothetical protein
MSNGTKATFLCALSIAALLASPLAAAMAYGVDAAGVREAKAAGWTPKYGQIWVGAWTARYGWSGLDSSLAALRDAGVTPVIEWYYWADQISVNCVKYGCAGRSVGQWNQMATTLAQHVRKVMGDRPALIVLESEFNKNGISGWEEFDGHLVNQERIFRQNAPNAKLVVGFGAWGGYERFDRAAAGADYVGFQMMRATTRNSAWDVTHAGDAALATVRALRNAFHKPVILHDLAIGSYGANGQKLQNDAIYRLGWLKGSLQAAGLQGIVWRYVRDNGYSSGYFGPAESTWGLKTASGAPKPAWWAWVGLARSG